MSRTRPPEFSLALLIIDMQNGFCAQGGSYEKYGVTIGAVPEAYQQIVPNIARLADTCRELGISIFYSQQVREESGIDLFTRLHRIVPERRAEYLRIPACIRGTWDADIIDELKDYGVNVLVSDPLADPDEAQSYYDIRLQPFEKIKNVDAVILAVMHKVYRDSGLAGIAGRCADSNALVIDVKGCFTPAEASKLGVTYLRL